MTLLDRELIKNISKNIGIIPDLFAKSGITNQQFLTNKTISFLEDDQAKESNVWYGESKGIENIVCCTVTILDLSENNFEYCAIISFKDFTETKGSYTPFYGLKFNQNDKEDNGLFLLKVFDKWIPMTTEQKLRLALGFESMITDGFDWEPGEITKEIIKELEDFISIDS